jgi:hypothetical protein
MAVLKICLFIESHQPNQSETELTPVEIATIIDTPPPSYELLTPPPKYEDWFKHAV